MTCRVHYVNPEGRPAWKDVVASREDAESVFRHLYPGVRRVDRVDVIGGTKPKTAGVRRSSDPAAVVDADETSDEVRARLKAMMRAFRESLAASTPTAGSREVTRKKVACPTCGGRATESTNGRTGISRVWTLGCGHGPFPPL